LNATHEQYAVKHCLCIGENAVDKALQTVDVERPVPSMELTGSELEQQMEEIQFEMEKRTQRAAKYKRLYLDEKKKCEEVTAQLQMLLKVLLHCLTLVWPKVQYN